MTETRTMQHEPNTAEQAGRACGNGGEDNRLPVIRAGQGQNESRPRVVRAGSSGEKRHEPQGQGALSSPRVVRAGGDPAKTTARAGARCSPDRAEEAGTNVMKSAAAAKDADALENRGADDLLRSGIVLSIGAQHAIIEWVGYSHRALERNFRALGKLMGCRTAKDVVDVQLNLFKSSVEDWLRGTNAVLRISAENTREAARGIPPRPAPSTKY